MYFIVVHRHSSTHSLRRAFRPAPASAPLSRAPRTLTPSAPPLPGARGYTPSTTRGGPHPALAVFSPATAEHPRPPHVPSWQSREGLRTPDGLYARFQTSRRILLANPCGDGAFRYLRPP